MTERLLSRHIEDIADCLRGAAAAAQAAQTFVVDGKPSAALELLVEQLAPLHDALTLIRLILLEEVISAQRTKC